MSHWRQGYLLATERTRRISAPLREILEQEEKREVYENFTEEDEGRARTKVCVCLSSDLAAQIAREHNAYEALVELATEARDHLYEKQDILRVREMAKEVLKGLIQ
jgi:hypothetical protein